MAHVRVLRGGAVESLHRVHVAACMAHGTTVAHAGDPGFATYLRSAAKPFQAAAVLASGAGEKFALTDEEVAVVAGSHGGEDAHVRVVEGLLAKLGLGADALRCGRHPPYHKPTAAALGDAYGPLHHNCSGKHAGMLAAALALGADPATYLEREHPVQRAVLRTMAAFSGLPEADVGVGVDGCGVPCFRMPLAAAATAFARLARPAALAAPERAAAERVARAMVAHPYLVAGRTRLDTDLMDAAEGRLLAKAGAEAYEAMADLTTGVGLALKIEDGASRAVAPAAVEAARQMGWLEPRALEVLGEWWRPALRNHAGREVGGLEPAFELARPTG